MPSWSWGLKTKAYLVQPRVDAVLQVRVHLDRRGRRDDRFGLAQVLLAEEKLAREVRVLDDVGVRQDYLPVAEGPEARHRVVFEQLTADCAGADLRMRKFGVP